MSKNDFKYRRIKLAFLIILNVLINTIAISVTTLYASAVGSPSELSASATISHTHRGSTSISGGCYTNPIYHTHIGSQTYGTGCFSQPIYHVHSSACEATGTCNVRRLDQLVYSYSSMSPCPRCGATTAVTFQSTMHHSNCGQPDTVELQGGGCIRCGGNSYDYTHDYTYYGCDKDSSTIEYYEAACGHTEGVDIDSYSLSCGLEEREYGTIIFTNQTPAWTSENVTLNGSLTDNEGVISARNSGAISFSTSDGTIASESTNSIEVSENGTYYMNVSIDSNWFDCSSPSLSLTVCNIDRTPPSVSVDYDTSGVAATSNTITISATDYQPDGTLGAGLPDTPYSFDGGNTWVSSNTYICTRNDTIDIKVRDILGNEYSTSATISNIDDQGPEVTYTLNPDRWYEGDPPRAITIEARDDGAGLHDTPYSYDGGQTWTALNVTTVSEPGDIQVLVRDALGNITEVIIHIEYDIPELEPEEEPEPEEMPEPEEVPEPIIPTEVDDNVGGDDGDYDTTPVSSEVSTPPTLWHVVPIPSPKIVPDSAFRPLSEIPSPVFPEQHASILTLPVPDYIIPSEPKAYKEITYFEQVPTSGVVVDLSIDDNPHIPFYKTTAFKVAMGIGGIIVAMLILLLMFLLLYAGIRVYSYDSVRYRFLSLLPIHRSNRGYHINITNDLISHAYSNQIKIVMGRIYIKRHENELLYVHIEKDWIPIPVQRENVIIL